MGGRATFLSPRRCGSFRQVTQQISFRHTERASAHTRALAISWHLTSGKRVIQSLPPLCKTDGKIHQSTSYALFPLLSAPSPFVSLVQTLRPNMGIEGSHRVCLAGRSTARGTCRSVQGLERRRTTKYDECGWVVDWLTVACSQWVPHQTRRRRAHHYWVSLSHPPNSAYFSY